MSAEPITTSYICPKCLQRIQFNELSEPARDKGRFTGQRQHVACPETALSRALRQMQADGNSAGRAPLNAPSVSVPFDPRKPDHSFPWPLIFIGVGIVLAAIVLASMWGQQ